MEKITSKHFMFFIVAPLAATLFNYPSTFIRLGGRNTWIFSIISSLIFLLFAWIILSIISKKNAYDFKQVCYKSLGKHLGNLFLFIFIFYLAKIFFVHSEFHIFYTAINFFYIITDCNIKFFRFKIFF